MARPTGPVGDAPVKHFVYEHAIANGHVGLIEQANDAIVELDTLEVV